MELIYLKSALKCDSFDLAIDIKIQFFWVLVTIEPGRSLLQFLTTNCLIEAALEKCPPKDIMETVAPQLCPVGHSCTCFSAAVP